MRTLWKFVLGALCLSAIQCTAVHAQTNSYKQTPLVSDTMGMAPHTNAKLVNPWGIAFIPGQPFWVSDNNSGFTTLYDQTEKLQGAFTVAPPMGSSNIATPTGIVAAPANVNFNVGGAPSIFIFDTEDGTISGWTGAQSTIIAVDNSQIPSAASGAVYKGLALLQNNAGNFLLATNFRSGKVEVYDTNFHQTQAFGASAFTDLALPAAPVGSGSPGYAPFGIHTLTINGQRMVLVTYALQDTPMHDPLHIAGSGVIDLFNSDGSMARRVSADAHLNAPWGAVMPPPGFGAFAGDLLIGNFGDGTINAYDPTSGNFIDQMKDGNGAAITNLSLWDMVFGAGGQSGDPNTLYITAGLANEQHGLFASIVPGATATPDFTISATPASLTINAGQSATFTVTLSGLNGFNSSVALSCSGLPANSTCAFSMSPVSPPSGGTVTSMMTITTSSAPYMAAAMISAGRDGILRILLAIAALVLLGLIVVQTNSGAVFVGKMRTPRLAGALVLIMAASFLLFASGCGNYSAGNGTQRGSATVMITGTSGNLSHSTSVTLTVQ
ncbi:MAG TPA: TIGR03118 family protein [Candidatus Acidoferrum sp.]|nr:TIGR03118 family protein [Candidatus Acidoferrum sp.]